MSNGTAKILTEDQIDEILYCSRAGELEDLKTSFENSLKENNNFDEILESIQHSNESQNSPLHYAAANGHHTIVTYISEKCSLASILAQNDAGNTPLHWAAFNGHSEIVKDLINRIESLAPKPTSDESTKIAELTEEERDAIAEKEARQRSIWDVVNKAGRGPMSEAQMNGKEAIVDFMLQRMVTAPTGAPSDEAVPEQDTTNPAQVAVQAEEEGITQKTQDLNLQ